jgi:hypothetical protein
MYFLHSIRRNYWVADWFCVDFAWRLFARLSQSFIVLYNFANVLKPCCRLRSNYGSN